MSDMHGTVCWTELMTRDLPGAKAFYAKICGWEFDTAEVAEGWSYTMGMKDGAPVVGLMDMNQESDDAEAGPFWMSYFAVDDVDRAVAEVESAGGEVKRAPFDIPETGRIAVVRDPSGALLGLMTPEGSLGRLAQADG